jgi:hypothetical protein
MDKQCQHFFFYFLTLGVYDYNKKIAGTERSKQAFMSAKHVLMAYLNSSWLHRLNERCSSLS